MFDQKTRTAIKINTNNFGDGLAGRGLGLNNTIAELRPLVDERDPRAAQPRLARRPGCASCSSRSTASPRRRRRWPKRRPTSTSTWTRSSRPGRASRKSLEEATEGGPASLEQAIYSLPHEAPFDRKRDRVHAPAAPQRERPASRSRPPLGHAFKEGAVNLAAATALNTRLAESSEALAEFGQNPVVTLAFEDFTQTLEVGNPLLAGIAPEQAQVQLLDAGVPQRREPRVREHRRRHARARRLRARADGPQQRGLPVLRARQRPLDRKSVEAAGTDRSTTTTCTSTPTPTSSGPGQAQVCEAGNETYVPGQAEIGNLPAGDVSTNRELTAPRTEPVRRNVLARDAQGPRTASQRRRANEPPALAGADATRCRSSNCGARTPCASRSC